MHATTEPIVTAEMKITRTDGTVETQEVELDELTKRTFAALIRKEH